MVERVGVCILLLVACSTPAPDDRTPVAAGPDLDALDARVEEILGEYRVATAGAALIKSGEIVWTGY